MLAAKQARTIGAHEEALEHLENALSLWEGEKGVRAAELMASTGPTDSERDDVAVRMKSRDLTAASGSDLSRHPARAGEPLLDCERIRVGPCGNCTRSTPPSASSFETGSSGSPLA